MNPPFSFSGEVANNIVMEEMSDDERVVNHDEAFRQFNALYAFMAAQSQIYLLPTPVGCGLQDLVFTANLGMALDHLPMKDTVVLSNFTSEPRIGEAEVGRTFFELMGYKVEQSPHKFEGEADLKHLHDDVYVGGYGLRTEEAAFDWMEKEFGMRIVRLRITNPYMYHLDGSVFPLTRDKTLVCTEVFTKEEVRALEAVTEIIDVTQKEAEVGITSAVRLGMFILNGSSIHEMSRGDEFYALERDKNRRIEDIVTDNGYEPVFFNISEFEKGGALLSCLVMHLNRAAYDYQV